MTGVTIRGDAPLRDDLPRATMEQLDRQYAILAEDARDLTIADVTVEDYYGTPLKLLDVEGLRVRACTLRRIGVPAISGQTYSSDAIFVGGRLAGARDARIEDCVFEDLGTVAGMRGGTDCDAIQLQSPAGVSEVVIRGNTFRRVTQRGVKIQDGREIAVTDNRFVDCGQAVVCAVATGVSDIDVSGNLLIGVSNPFESAGINPADPLPVRRWRIVGNVVDSCTYFYRASSGAILTESTISENVVGGIEAFFFEGSAERTTFRANVFGPYGYRGPTGYYAFFFNDGGDHNRIEDNVATRAREVVQFVRREANQTNVDNTEARNEVVLRKREP